ncbi:AbiH family protein [Flavobacterium taihuense]|uniref:Bacteriophage abortive infection AbiH family protein n=1 Tax=Flavobacterium taihuense TaxID=2857508 RepID=A0ABS6XR14_9FLAO|nr:AbiH family protein [Flavobacterium taihuense]MBW4359110.1 bacteriophage abortive infection AbiH family protein [Flavobacterium taihuense]
MNRLVIIGNGFDLAHGLPTSYKDFINDFWKNFKDKCQSEEYQKLVITHDLYNGYYNGSNRIENFNDLKLSLKNYSQENGHRYDSDNFHCSYNRHIIFAFRNDFFKLINKKNSENWVDIENEYYYQLKKIVKSKCLDVSKSNEYWSNEQSLQVIKLNNEFEQIKKLLEKYLKDNILNAFQLGNFYDPRGEIFKFSDVIKPISILSDEDKILEEFSNEDHHEIKSQLKKEKSGMTETKTKLFFLNFNYTPTLYRYLNNGKYNDKIETIINFIHGEIGNINENKINFGFGDEMDDDYKMIENLDDNEYLKNFKSFQYLQNSNYKQLLDFVESDQKFQVYIMGHSCGLSDRTMLNTIFEHPNCRSIKVFYHQREDGTDNYTEIIQNISRHFNKKKLMREKIVNKTLCQPLPKIQLPLK